MDPEDPTIKLCKICKFNSTFPQRDEVCKMCKDQIEDKNKTIALLSGTLIIASIFVLGNLFRI